MAREKSQDVAREIDGAFRVLSDRGIFFADLFKKDDANARVDEATDEAIFVLESAGVRPLILLFDEDEVKRLGDKPLACLVALQERALELLRPQPVEAAGQASEVLAEALELAKLLAEGEEARDWTDDDQEPEASEEKDDKEGEADQEGKAGQEDEAGQQGQEGEDQDGQRPEDTASESEDEPGEVADAGEETPPEASEPHGRGSKSRGRGRRRGDRA
jgi:hypothetical protein